MCFCHACVLHSCFPSRSGQTRLHDSKVAPHSVLPLDRGSCMPYVRGHKKYNGGWVEQDVRHIAPLPVHHPQRTGQDGI